jgi:hypothetical protein
MSQALLRVLDGDLTEAQREVLLILSYADRTIPVLADRWEVHVVDPLLRAGLFELRNHDGDVVHKSWGEVGGLGFGRNWPGLHCRITDAGLDAAATGRAEQWD